MHINKVKKSVNCIVAILVSFCVAADVSFSRNIAALQVPLNLSGAASPSSYLQMTMRQLLEKVSWQIEILEDSPCAIFKNVEFGFDFRNKKRNSASQWIVPCYYVNNGNYLQARIIIDTQKQLVSFLTPAQAKKLKGMPLSAEVNESDGHIPSILDAAEFNIREAAHIMEMDNGLLEAMLKPDKILRFSWDQTLERGEKVTIWAFRAEQNNSRGIYKGGLRWLVGTGKTPEEAEKTAIGLATLMTIKNAVLGLPYGGGKGDIFVPEGKYTLIDEAQIVRNFAWRLVESGGVGTFIDVPAPDQGTDSSMMAWFLDEVLKCLAINGAIYDPEILTALQLVTPSNDHTITPFLDVYIEKINQENTGILKGIELGYITSKPAEPVWKGGSLGRTKSTGFGGFLSFKAVLKYFSSITDIGNNVLAKNFNKNVMEVLKKDISRMTVGIQGSGNVGEYDAWEFFRAGSKIVLFQDADTTLFNKNGIDLNILNKYLPRTGDKWASFKTLPLEFFAESGCELVPNPDFFWETYTDVKVAAAKENVITAKNASKVACEVILELANNPTTPDADRKLNERGILVIPDVAANVGGVTVSYFEWLQNIEGRRWSALSVDKMLEERINIEFADMIRVAEKFADKNVSLRQAAFILAMARVADAMIARDASFYRQYSKTRPHRFHGELGIFPDTIEELELVSSRPGGFEGLIAAEEANHTIKIQEIVSQIEKRFVGSNGGVVLVGGPRTSGKIAFAERVAYRLRQTNGVVKYLDLDLQVKTYYSSLKEYGIPEDEIPPMVIKKMAALIGSIISRDEPPSYVFVREKGQTTKKLIHLGEKEVLVVEGNFALRQEIIDACSSQSKSHYGVFINTAPSMKLAGNWPLTSMDMRFIRDILTFSKHFGQDPLSVIQEWPRIRELDLKYAYPTWRNADATFNSYLTYELSVLKPHIERLLKSALKSAVEKSDYQSRAVIKYLLDRLEGVPGIPVDVANSFVPPYSIVRQSTGRDSKIFTAALMITKEILRVKSVQEVVRLLRSGDRTAHMHFRYALSQGITDHLKKSPFVKRVWLFGDVGKGQLEDVRRTSDIDLLIEVADENNRIDAFEYLASLDKAITEIFNKVMRKSKTHLFEVVELHSDRVLSPEMVREKKGPSVLIGNAYEPASLLYERPEVVEAPKVAQKERSLIDFFENIGDKTVLVQKMRSILLSAFLSGKKLTLSFRKDIRGFQDPKFADLMDILPKLMAEDAILKDYKDRLLIIKNFDNAEALHRILASNGIDLDNPDNLVFAFTPDIAEAVETGLDRRIKSVLIANNEQFNIETFYYPLPEIVHITLVAYLRNYSPEELMALINKKSKAGLNSINLEDIEKKGNAFLIFTLLPSIEKENGKVNLYLKLKRAFESAA